MIGLEKQKPNPPKKWVLHSDLDATAIYYYGSFFELERTLN